MKRTYLFYDLETSGLNTAFDQILTFACIRTDEMFGEIDRREIKVKLRPDVVPSPGALLVNRLPVEKLNQGLCEYEAALRIHEELNTPGTISLGYNTLGFDDEFLRFTFYRNLLDPYTHQYSRGCGRMDIFPITALYWIFKPELLNWPLKESGEPSLRLELLGRENSLLSKDGRSHEAMADVQATLNLAVLLSAEEPTFQYAAGFFDKETDRQRIESIGSVLESGGKSFRVGIAVSPFMGSDANYLSPVVCLGRSKVYNNQHVWLRLDREDLDVFQDTAPEESVRVVLRKRYGDLPFILPFFDRFYDRIPQKGKTLTDYNLQLLERKPDLLEKLIEYHVNFAYRYIPDLDPDAALYQDGFFTRSEKCESLRFHQAGPAEKSAVADSMENSRTRTLAKRILGRNFYSGSTESDSGPADEFGRVQLPMEETVKGFRDDVKLTVKAAADELEEHRKRDLDLEQAKIAQQLDLFLRSSLDPE
ncbi:MAG: exonuclease domain-containing protein [Thermodesulfobacteriota bacterium]